ncbi:helix-turn-helix domain-containing protein [Streptomyces anulatus]|uniref:helix-turn-helix domain-containing protein n=1 Tax=Streptomyces anulatus TaxID=1892 RepID=UPI0027E3A166|nr:helix-turn-helix domain-containing protein [Streptomyces anulatus]
MLCAAGEVFAEYGYHRASVGQIMDRSKVTKGALYFHFASKEAMAAGVLARLQEPDTIEIPAGPVRLQTLITLVNGYADPPLTDPVLRGALRLVDEPEFEGSAWQERLHLTITGLLTDAAHAGELLSHVAPADTAELITTVLAGLRRFAPGPEAGDAALDRIAIMWRHLLPSIAIPALIPALDLQRRPPGTSAPGDQSAEASLPSGSGSPPPGGGG